jgi:SAM-dependent methyltransferase
MRAADWNRKYEERPLVWGTGPNRFVEAETADLPAGRALDLACGEGRNALWLALRGWDVTGIDFSDVAVARGVDRATRDGLTVDLRVGDVLEADLGPIPYDLVLVSYLQLPAGERVRVLERAARAVGPGGTFVLVAHDVRNHAEGTGGPSNPAVLWTAAETVAALEEAGLVIDHAGEVLREVDGAARPAIDTLVRAHRPR